jgi:hypothetical protein
MKAAVEDGLGVGVGLAAGVAQAVRTNVALRIKARNRFIAESYSE